MGTRSIAGPGRRRSSPELRSRVAERDLAISLRELVLPLACLATYAFECPSPTPVPAGGDAELSPSVVAGESPGLYAAARGRIATGRTRSRHGNGLPSFPSSRRRAACWRRTPRSLPDPAHRCGRRRSVSWTHSAPPRFLEFLVRAARTHGVAAPGAGARTSH